MFALCAVLQTTMQKAENFLISIISYWLVTYAPVNEKEEWGELARIHLLCGLDGQKITVSENSTKHFNTGAGTSETLRHLTQIFDSLAWNWTPYFPILSGNPAASPFEKKKKKKNTLIGVILRVALVLNNRFGSICMSITESCQAVKVILSIMIMLKMALLA